MTPRRWMIGIAMSAVLLTAGCRNCCKKQTGCPNPTFGPPGPAVGGPATLPPQGLPPLDVPPPARASQRPEILLPQNPPTSSNYPVPSPAPTPSSSTPPPRGNGNVTLGEPDFSAPAAGIEEKKTAVKPPLANPGNEMPSSPLPVGIASFAQVKDGVSAGLRPDLDGLDWLQSKGYKTVVFLRNGKDDDSSDRKQVEKRGLKYVGMTVTPETINPATVAEFNRLVNDPEGRSLFVYDLDGKRAGAIWYLYFRTSEMLTDEQARLRAGRFGLKDKGDAEQVQLWTAVQKYMSERTN